MDGLGFIRRGLILGVTAGVSATASAQHVGKPTPLQPPYHRSAPQHLGWQYYGLSAGPYINGGAGRGALVGPAWGPGWAGNFPYFWGIPGAAGSVWTNNLSLYGPPIPTYAPVPGVFGQNDMSRLFFDQPAPGFYGSGYRNYGAVPRGALGGGLGWGGAYSPSPRPRNPSVRVFPTGPASVSVAGNDGTTPANVIRVCVKVHDPEASLWVERQPLTLTGTERIFESPDLEPGQTYRYEVIAKWQTGGREQAETRTVTARPGDLVTVDFSVPE